jgi:hypothetical protein
MSERDRSPAWIRRMRIWAAKLHDIASRSEGGDEHAKNMVGLINLSAIIVFLVLVIGGAAAIWVKL